MISARPPYRPACATLDAANVAGVPSPTGASKRVEVSWAPCSNALLMYAQQGIGDFETVCHGV